MEWIGELMFLVLPCTPNLFFQLPVYSSLVTMGLEGVGQQSVGISLPSSILLNTLTLLITDKTFNVQNVKTRRRQCVIT